MATRVKRRKTPKRKPYQPVDYDKFYETRCMAGLSREEAACLLHVSERTIQLWESGKTSIPYAAYKLLRISTGFELPGKTWEGWCLRGGYLWSPADRRFDPAELAYLQLTFSMARHWQAEYDQRAAARLRSNLLDSRYLGKPVLKLVKA